MLQLLQDWQRKPLVDALMAFKGFKLVAAMVTVSEQHRRPGGVLDDGEAEARRVKSREAALNQSSSGNKQSRGGI
jgi:hypothetical protein